MHILNLYTFFSLSIRICRSIESRACSAFMVWLLCGDWMSWIEYYDLPPSWVTAAWPSAAGPTAAAWPSTTTAWPSTAAWPAIAHFAWPSRWPAWWWWWWPSRRPAYSDLNKNSRKIFELVFKNRASSFELILNDHQVWVSLRIKMQF